MAFQLVYTSAAKLLDAGRSGYGTVARSKSITPLVVSAIERVSQFANLRGLDRNRVIHVHRRITAGSNRFHILTRIVDAGADYTGRTNHLAHHLVISQEEAARAAARGITPADVLRQFPWLDRWDGAARFFDANEDVPLDHFRPDGRNSGSQSWAALTGNPAHARLLSWEAAPRTGVLVIPVAVDTLHLLAEALAEFGPQSWSRSFTTSLETTDELSELEWVISTPQAFPEIQSRCGSRTLYDLSHPQTLPTPPAPVMPATSPATARQDYPGAQEAESSVSSARQPGANPVTVNIAPSGARAGGASLRRSNPKQDKKTQIKLRVGFAALLLVAGIFVIAILKGDGTDEKDPKSATTGGESQVKTDPLQEIAVTELKKINISAENASSIISLGSDWKEWKTLIIESDKFIKEVSGSEKTTETNLDFPDLPKLNDQSKPPQWATDLYTLIQDLKTLAKNKEENAWSKPFDLACANIDNLKKDGSMPTFAGDNERFKKALFRMFAKPRLQEAIDQPSGQDSTPKLEALISVIQAHEKFFEAADFFKLKESLDKKLRDSQAQNEKKPVQYSYSTTSSSVSLDALLSKVADKQIILASPDVLKTEGVPVELLEAIMKYKMAGPSTPEISLDTDIIELPSPDRKNYENKLLKLSEDEKYYCWKHWNNPEAPKYYTNGKFALNKDGVMSVRFSHPNKIAYIVVDKESDDVFDDVKLTFELVPVDMNSGKLQGTLAEQIKLIKPDDARGSLRFVGADKQWNWKLVNDNWILTRIVSTAPPLLFSKIDAASLETDLAALITNREAIYDANAGTQRDNIKKETDGKVSILKKSLCIAVGGGQLLQELKLETHDLLNESQWNSAKAALKRMKITRSAEFKNNWEKDSADIKEKIGDAKLDDVIKNCSSAKDLNPKTWDKLKDNPALLIAVVTDLVNRSKNYKPENPISTDLEAIQSITVVSAKGCVLFKATKEP